MPRRRAGMQGAALEHLAYSPRTAGKIDWTMLAYEEIRRSLGGDDSPPRFIIHRRGLILALCLRANLHPRVNANPAEVWVSADEHVLEWGERLAWDTGAVWLFASNGSGTLYRPRGIYNVTGSSSDPVELARRLVFPEIDSLSRVVFLSREPVVEVEAHSQLTQGSEL